MESLFETLLFILPWTLFGITLIAYGDKINKCREASETIKHLKSKINKLIETESVAMKEAQYWEKLATCPPINPTPDPLLK